MTVEVALARETPYRKDAGGVGSLCGTQKARPNVASPATGSRSATTLPHTSQRAQLGPKPVIDKDLLRLNLL